MFHYVLLGNVEHKNFDLVANMSSIILLSLIMSLERKMNEVKQERKIKNKEKITLFLNNKDRNIISVNIP